jgi:hypothetical protein
MHPDHLEMPFHFSRKMTILFSHQQAERHGSVTELLQEASIYLLSKVRLSFYVP